MNVLAAASKGMWAVKLCSNKILQFLTVLAAGEVQRNEVIDSVRRHKITAL